MGLDDALGLLITRAGGLVDFASAERRLGVPEAVDPVLSGGGDDETCGPLTDFIDFKRFSRASRSVFSDSDVATWSMGRFRLGLSGFVVLAAGAFLCWSIMLRGAATMVVFVGSCFVRISRVAMTPVGRLIEKRLPAKVSFLNLAINLLEDVVGFTVVLRCVSRWCSWSVGKVPCSLS